MADFDQEKRQPEGGPWSHPVFGYLAAFLLPCAAVTAMALLVRGFPSFRFQGVLVMLAVLVVALNWGLGPSVLATFVGTVLLLFLPLSPLFSLGMVHSADVLGVCLSLGVGLTVSVLTSHMQRARRHADVVLRDVTQRRQLEQRTHTLLNALLTMAEILVQAPDTGKAGNHQPSLPTREVAEHLGELTRNVLDCQAATIIALQPHTDRMSPVASIGFSPQQERLFWTTIPGKRLSERLADPALFARLQAGRMLLLDLTQPPWCEQAQPDGVHSAHVVPMRLRGQLVGTLTLHPRETSPDYSAEEMALAEAVAQLAALVVERELLLHERAEAQAHVLALATTDPVTALPNHRALIARLDQELERAHQYHRFCSILFLDLDHFKALNDGYGHAAGDAALSEFAGLMQKQLRGMDTVGRWGGEEFVAILPERTADEALHFAEEVRACVAARIFSVGGGIYLTCSIGVANYPTHAQEREGLLSAADQAMYGAKCFGRNQVRAANDPAVHALRTAGQTEGGREEAALMGMVEALATLVEVRDTATGHHAHQVADLVLQLALAMGLSVSEAQMIALAGRLHDVGKVSIPDAVLQKPGRLSAEEWGLVRIHPMVGADVVGHIPALRPLVPVIRAHHERWDGQGYPDRLEGEAIPFGARLLLAVDAYLAMTVDRPYQKARAPSVALTELRRCAGSQFDPQVVAALEQVLRGGQLPSPVAHGRI